MKIKQYCKTGFLAALPIGCVAGIGMLTAQAQEEYNGTLNLGVGGVIANGSQAAFQQRLQQNGNFYGGLSGFTYEREVGDVLWTMEGRALYGNDDYAFILGASKEGLGYLEIGYQEYTTFYDGTGGYLPGFVTPIYPINDDEYELDRGEAWLEAGLRVDDLPEITFRYSHLWRDGQKDSTSWGRPDSRAIQHTLNDIDETRDVFELDIAHAFGNTDLALGLRYELMDNSQTRIMENGAESHNDAFDAELFNAHASSVSRLNDQMMLSFGYSFTTFNSDTYVKRTGSILGYNDGGANQKMNVVNASFWWNPIEDLTIVPSVRAEWNDADARSNFWYDGYGGDGYANPNVSVQGYTVTEQIEATYTGIDNIALYTKLTFEQEEEDTNWDYFQELDPSFAPGEIPSLTQSGYRYKDGEINRMKATIGGTWYAKKGLSFAAEYYYKQTDIDYTTINTGTGLTHFGDAHIQSLDMETNDFNLRMTWRPRSDLTLVTRYDYQLTTFDTVGFDGGLAALPEVEAGEYVRNILSQSATYLINESMYLQGSVSYTMSDTESAGSKGDPSILTRSDNDYLTTNLTVGYALDDKTELTAGYSYFLAKNFTVPSGSVGYGTDLEEHVFSLGVTRALSPAMIWNMGYAYYASNDGDSGGNSDFDVHMLSTGLQVKF